MADSLLNMGGLLNSITISIEYVEAFWLGPRLSNSPPGPTGVFIKCIANPKPYEFMFDTHTEAEASYQAVLDEIDFYHQTNH